MCGHTGGQAIVPARLPPLLAQPGDEHAQHVDPIPEVPDAKVLVGGVLVVVVVGDGNGDGDGSQDFFDGSSGTLPPMVGSFTTGPRAASTAAMTSLAMGKSMGVRTAL